MSNNATSCRASPKHFRLIEQHLRPDAKAECEACGDAEARLAVYCEQGIAETLIIDGLVAAIIGVLPMWKGAGDSWALTTDFVERAPIWFHKRSIAIMERATEELGLWRIQASVRADNARAIEWHYRLGYVLETPEPMKKYGPDGTDYYLMARVV